MRQHNGSRVRHNACRRGSWWGEAPERPRQLRRALGFPGDLMGYVTALAEP
jgi:hypothetical protein